MQTFLKSFKLVVVFIGLISYSSVSVSTDCDLSVDFSQYKTYKWGISKDLICNNFN